MFLSLVVLQSPHRPLFSETVPTGAYYQRLWDEYIHDETFPKIDIICKQSERTNQRKTKL